MIISASAPEKELSFIYRSVTIIPVQNWSESFVELPSSIKREGKTFKPVVDPVIIFPPVLHWSDTVQVP
jgi:hypothetical protein